MSTNSITTFSFEECLDTIRTGNVPSFFDGPYEAVVLVLYLDSWHCFTQPPDIALFGESIQIPALH